MSAAPRVKAANATDRIALPWGLTATIHRDAQLRASRLANMPTPPTQREQQQQAFDQWVSVNGVPTRGGKSA